LTARAMAQRMCIVAEDTKETRGILSTFWENPDNSMEVLREAEQKNEDLCRFELLLESVELSTYEQSTQSARS